MSTTRSRRVPAGVWFAAPALVAIGLFFHGPVIAAFALGVTDFDIYSLADVHRLRFVGLDNFRALFDDPRFATALRNTLYFVVVGAPISVAVSLAAALGLEARLTRLRGFLRTVYFLPVVSTLVAVAVLWRYLYHPRAGLLNHLLAFLGIGPIDWLGDPAWAMPAIIGLAVWKGFGFNTLIFVAGLAAVPERLYEAARVDGAGAWRRFRHVTVPMLGPTFLFVTIVTMSGSFQLFAEPYVMTRGGPADATLSMVLLMYERGFRWWSLGSAAAAVAFVLWALMLAATGAALLVQERRATLLEPPADAVVPGAVAR